MGVLCSSAERLSNAVIEGLGRGRRWSWLRWWEPGAGRPSLLAQALRRLLDGPEEARRMADAARDFIERHLTFERLVSQHEALCSKLLAAERGALRFSLIGARG